MKNSSNTLILVLAILAIFFLPTTQKAFAGGGYFSMGYGPIAKQTAGAVTAVAEDAYAGGSNPAKLIFAGNRLDVGVELFNPHRKVNRTGATGPDAIFNFSSKSKNDIFLLPEFAYAKKINANLSLGITAYANGGLNSEYHDTTGIPGTNANPVLCGNLPGNFYLGCGEAGFDLAQLIVAPTIAWKITPDHSIGIAPLLAVQTFEFFGLQAFAPTSLFPDKVTNNGHGYTFGAGVRIGWFGQITPWLDLGAAYSSKVYMQDFDKYKGLFAEGSFDIPANYSIGAAIKPNADWKIAFDIQRIEYSHVKSISNGVLNTLRDPVSNPLGSDTGSGFGWQRDQTNYKLGVSYKATPKLTVRFGYAYGKRSNKNDINATSFSLLTPNPIHQASVGFSYKRNNGNEFHLGFAHYFKTTYSGPSALFPGATESVKPYVNALSATMTWKF